MFDLASREFPLSALGATRLAPADEDPALVLDNGCDDVQWLRW
ncbi:hypothetical protein SAMN05216219_2234 [Mycetocola miduiensis]|uniref:Uncharacterized protein n=1 Tax=Mycetocola miduiensis TaxID=995034 RepID=A0A1I5C5Y8_9MICO|nr:hypothetical protein SAMN05216219_2234 [Mycetocola miduiensis]